MQKPMDLGLVQEPWISDETSEPGFITWKDGDKQMEHKLDLSKPVQTRDGRSVELLTTNGQGIVPIVGYISNYEHISVWYANGLYWNGNNESINDLVNIPERKTAWVNLYLTPDGDVWATSPRHKTKEAADLAATYERVGCCEIEWIE